MKLITAIIKPERLEKVRKALNDSGVQGVTTTQAKGFGRQRGQSEVYRGTEVKVDFLPKIKLEVVVTDSKYEQILQTIIDTARTGNIGDGKIFVSKLEDVVRIRTGEKGENAV